MPKLLNYATQKLLFSHPIFSIMKKDYKVDDKDIIAIHKFLKGNEIVMIENPIHANTLIKDKRVEKVYYSTEIIPDYEFLSFIQLGIEYLLEHAELEDAQKGKIILQKLIHKLEKEIICPLKKR